MFLIWQGMLERYFSTATMASVLFRHFTLWASVCPKHGIWMVWTSRLVEDKKDWKAKWGAWEKIFKWVMLSSLITSWWYSRWWEGQQAQSLSICKSATQPQGFRTPTCINAGKSHLNERLCTPCRCGSGSMCLQALSHNRTALAIHHLPTAQT